ncbi:MAG TPA: diguanylate cyclase [Anaerolineae bacterium]|nr:diguanylate cyclase [Anaerolineae bacterium]
MSRKAKLYIGAVICLGAVLSMLSLPGAAQFANEWLPFAVLVVLTTIAHLYISDTVSHEAWAINLVFLFAGVLLLNSFGFVLLVIIPHLIEWAYELWVKKSNRLRNGYIQPFNIAVHLIAGGAARILFLSLHQDSTLISLNAFVAVLVAMLGYLFVNHLLIGGVLVFARGVTLRTSGVFELGNLLGDLLQLSLGYVVAVFWTINPILILPALAPLLLMYRALQVPKLAKEAQTDPKTGLYNPRRFNELFTAELERARRFNRPLAVVMADLDLLRNINNTYGHLAGDAVLTEVGRIIRENVREFDVASRFGGEEFSMVLLEADVEGGRAFANRLRRAIESADFKVSTSAQPIHVTMSLGVACFPIDAHTATDLIHLADVAVYQAKLRGRNCVVCASDVPRSITADELHVDLGAESAYRAAYATRPSEAPETAENAIPASAPAQGPVAESSAPRRYTQNSPLVLRLFLTATVLVALSLAGWGFRLWPTPDPIGIALFTVLAVCAELFQVNVYGFNTVSVSVAVIFASGLIAGLPGVTATSAAVALTHYFRARPQLHQTIFNWAVHVIAGTAPALMAYVLGPHFGIDNLLVLLVEAVIIGVVYYGIDTGLIAIAIGLSVGQSLWRTWQAQFRWLIYHYVALCTMGMFLAMAFQTLGLPGVIVFALPPFMMYYAQKQYVERTEESAHELQRMNQELTRANEEIVDANRSIKELSDELFLVLAKIIDARDPYVSSHTTKVADYAVAIAGELGLPTGRVESIRQAALLHDIGKIGVSEHILNKPAKLSSEEYQIVKIHTSLGAELLETCQSLRHLAPIVQHHHEWWNGTGYPDNLLGEAIPLESRILAVCDAVEAMASDRPYSRARSLDEIIAELRRCAGTQFDPNIVEKFVRVTERRGRQFVVNSARDVVRPQTGPQHDDATTASDLHKNVTKSQPLAGLDNPESASSA